MPTPAPAAPLAITHASQLFVDDHLIAARHTAHRRLNRPRKAGAPIVVADRPWESTGVLYGTVLEQGGEYWLYYKGRYWTLGANALNDADYRRQHGYGKYPICLARGHTPLAFHKEPPPGAAVPGTNIIIDDNVDCFGVLRDDAATDPAQRFKLIGCFGPGWSEGLTTGTSPDGVRWTLGPRHQLTFLGDRCAYWYDPNRRVHVAWSRNWHLFPSRVVVHKETADFARWDDPRAAEPRLVMQPDRLDHPTTQFYGAYAFWYQSVYLAYLEVYYIAQQRLDTQLCCSRDGINWQRLCDHDCFIPCGEHGEFDAYWTVPTFNPPIPHDGELIIHYNGRPDPHRDTTFSHLPPGMGGAFGLTRLREDGFVSLDATGTEGVVETKALQLPAARAAVEVNVCPFNMRPGFDPMGVTVEVLDGAGATVLAAWALRAPADGPPPVWYRAPLAAPLPDVVRLRFRLRNARLYSFRIAAS